MYERQQKPVEAQELILEVLERQERYLGPSHPDTLASKSALARLYWTTGIFDLAENIGIEVMQERKRRFGADHTSTLEAMRDLAWTLKSQGRHAEAIQLMEDVVCAQDKSLSGSDSNLQDAVETLKRWHTEIDS